MSSPARRQYGEGNISAYKITTGVRYRTQWFEPTDPTDPDSPKVRRQRAGFGTKKEAAAFLRGRLADIDRGDIKPDTGRTLTLADFMSTWLEGHRVGESARASYRRLVRLHITPYIGHLPLVKVTPQVLASLYRKLEAEGSRQRGDEGGPLGPNTVRKVHQVVSVCLKDAVEQKLISTNPAAMRGAKPPTLTEVASAKRQMEVWTREQLSDFLTWASVRASDLYAAWLLLAHTGARRGEACALTWSDIDLRGRTIHFRRNRVVVKNKGERTQTLVKTTKNDRSRSISISHALARELSSLRTRLAGIDLSLVHRDAPVLRLSSGRQPSPDYITERWIHDARAFVAEHPGVPYLNLHGLRHTHATHLLEAGVHPKDVQKRLGHETFAITMDLYSHRIDAWDQVAADLYEQFMGRGESTGG